VTEIDQWARRSGEIIQAQRIIANSSAPATSTTFTIDSHFSRNTFRMQSVLI